MTIGIATEHVELAESLGDWASSVGAIEAIRAAEGDASAMAAWAQTCAVVGLTSIAMAEPEGGGGTVLDQAVALAAAANALIPGAIVGTAIAATLTTDPELQRAIAAGTARVGVVVHNVAGAVVLDGPLATHLLVPGPDGWQIMAADQVPVEVGTSPDFGRPVSRLAEPVEVEPALDDSRVRQLLYIYAAAEAAGVARWCLETAVEYAKVREQFGQKIGAFQAIKHLCSQMLEQTEAVTAAAWDAAVAFDEAGEQAQFAALVAATVCFDGAVSVAHDCIQVLGGIGFTFEHDAHLYLRRALAWRAALGGAQTAAGELAELASQGVRRNARIDLSDADTDAIRAEVSQLVAQVAAQPEEERWDALATTGLLTPHWPAPYGRDATPIEQLVIDEELTAAGVQRPDLKIAAWAAPTILQHGSEAQKERFIGPTLRGEIRWCQLFSEPEAGSDLASLRTRAERVDGGWELTGQKVWTSLAQESEWGICLARTDAEAKPHAGITYFLVDMASPGLEIRPLREMTGEAMFNEVFLEKVFVPDDCVVGEVNGGWALARTTLANERVAMANTRLGVSVELALELLPAYPARALAAYQVGQAVAWATVTKLLSNRATLRSLAGRGPGSESSVAKLIGVESRQASAQLVMELLEHQAFAPTEQVRLARHEQLLTRCLSIAGGTTQILRNVVAERLLGLPRR